MKKLGLWIIGILIVIYIGYGVVLTSFSVNVTAKEQCYNETFECYRKCGTEKNRSCLLFKQGYWKGIFLWGYSFVEAKIKDIFNKEEFSEYGLLQWPSGTIKLEDFEKVGNIYSGDVWNEVFYKGIVGDTPENAAVMLVFKPDEILYTPYEKNTVLPESHENDIGFWTNLETFRKVTGLKEASSEYVGYFDGIYIFNPYVRVYKTRDEEKALIEKDKSEIISNDIYSELAGIIHNSEEGTITLDNGEESITIMDKNLGATTSGTGKESYGYYFQWGNNHGFQLNSEIKTGKDLVTRDVALQYGPNNWYDSDVQFVVMDNNEEVNRNLNLGNYFLAAVNDNLRGGSGDSEIVNRMPEYVIDQFRGDTGNPRTERKGPCPEGFHVPSFGEIHKLFKLWIDIKYPDDIEKKEHVRWMAIGGRGISTEFSNDLLLPKAGGIRFDGKGTPHDQDYRGYYWMSSPGRFLNFDNNGIVEYAESYRAATFPIRCFKD